MQNLLISTNELSRAGQPRPYSDSKNLLGIRGPIVFVQVEARSHRPYLVGVFSDSLLDSRPWATS